MALKIRLSRKGAKKNPYYRLVIQDVESPRDGNFKEIIGTYDPLKENEAEKFNFKRDRYDFWFSKGARPTRTVAQLVSRQAS
jgi:small subunit ribosomal protein S16